MIDDLSKDNLDFNLMVWNIMRESGPKAYFLSILQLTCISTVMATAEDVPISPDCTCAGF